MAVKNHNPPDVQRDLNNVNEYKYCSYFDFCTINPVFRYIFSVLSGFMYRNSKEMVQIREKQPIVYIQLQYASVISAI